MIALTGNITLSGIRPSILAMWFLLLLTIECCWLACSARAQVNCENAFSEAERNFGEGRLPEVIQRLSGCLPDGVPKSDRFGAYRLLALAHLAQDDIDSAREAIRQMLVLNRRYAVEADRYPPRFSELVEEIRPTIPKPVHEKLFGGIKKWFWVGGGVAAAIIFWPRTDPEPLPGPPPLP